jgi:dienelactone hydrolase
MHAFFRRTGWLLLTGLLALGAGCATVPTRSAAAPWDTAALGVPPAATWGGRTGLVQEVYYQGEPLAGRPTRVFAYLGRPESTGVGERFPAMVLVHGGGGKAFKDWAEHWARRGYVALAMDLSGNGPAGRLPDGGPDQSDAVKFREFGEAEVGEMWSYHAVAAVIRGHSLLRGLPEVDAERIGITGISWGGYLTCIVAGIDGRLKVAVPVYGCGFLGDNSVWKDGSLARMTPGSRERWLNRFDPSQYLAGVRCPILFLNGTTDFAYPLDSYQRSYRLVPERHRHLSVVVDLPHGHIWSFREVDTFVDGVLRKGEGLAEVGPTRVEGGVVSATVLGRVPVAEAALCYTEDGGPWPKRRWQRVSARIEGRRVRAELPPGAGELTGFLAVTDSRGLRVSGEHFQVTR